MDLASEKQASDILLLNISKVSSFADYFVIVTATNQRQIEALIQDITLALKRKGIRAFGREGTTDSGWVLLDLSNVIVHIFSSEGREYYMLEEAWNGARQVVRIQ
jgi:ribosome-associated protein